MIRPSGVTRGITPSETPVSTSSTELTVLPGGGRLEIRDLRNPLADQHGGRHVVQGHDLRPAEHLHTGFPDQRTNQDIDRLVGRRQD